MRRISEGRKTAFYVGRVISAIGLLLFLSTFLTFLLNFGNFDNFEGRAKSGGIRAFAGIIMILVEVFCHRAEIQITFQRPHLVRFFPSRLTPVV